ncbi:hypothetical protein GQX74_000239 [Glossina fuscipes]|nr:hypothetical protein GQX74_000239 [Glossina fuscipes]
MTYNCTDQALHLNRISLFVKKGPTTGKVQTLSHFTRGSEGKGNCPADYPANDKEDIKPYNYPRFQRDFKTQAAPSDGYASIGYICLNSFAVVMVVAMVRTMHMYYCACSYKLLTDDNSDDGDVVAACI